MHPQNLPINRCNPSPETTISQVTTYHCFCSPHQKIYSFVYFPLQLCFPVQQNHISVQKIERAAKSATLPYAFYIFEVLMSPLRSVQNGHPPDVLHPIYGMVHRNAISDFHSSVESDTFASSEV